METKTRALVAMREHPKGQDKKAVTLKDCADYARDFNASARRIMEAELKKQGVSFKSTCGIQTGIGVNVHGEALCELMSVLKQARNIIADACFLYAENIILTQRLKKLNPLHIIEVEALEC